VPEIGSLPLHLQEYSMIEDLLYIMMVCRPTMSFVATALVCSANPIFQGIDGKYLQIIQPGDADSDDNGMEEPSPPKPLTTDNENDISWDDVAYSLDETLGGHNRYR
jgi:hypothetical protein